MVPYPRLWDRYQEVRRTASAEQSHPGGLEVSTSLTEKKRPISASQTRALLPCRHPTMQPNPVAHKASLSDLKIFDTVLMAKKEHSAEFAQLASRISAVIKFSAGAGEDPCGASEGFLSYS